MQRKIAASLVIVVGAVFVVVTFSQKLFSVAPAFEELSDGFRPVMTADQLATLRADIDALKAVDAEFSSAAVPMFAEALGMSPEEFGAFMGESFPAVATGAASLGQITTSFEGIVNLLDQERERFASADAIPTSSIPATTIPWGLLVAGVVLIALGVYALLRPGRTIAIVVMVLGLVLVVGPIAMSLLTKAGDADTMNDNLKPVYTAEMVAGAQESLAVVGAMGTEMTDTMLPALAEQLGMTPEEVQAFMGENLPAISAGIAMLPDAMGRFTQTVNVFDANLENYDTINTTAFTPIVWTMIVGGAAALLVGAWLLFASRPEPAVEPLARTRPMEKVTTG
jgi:hypothetical protein